MAPSRGLHGSILVLVLFLSAFNRVACTARIMQANEDPICGLSLIQGFRDAMEDKALCLEPISVPLFKARSDQLDQKDEVGGKLNVRAFAVFDGHGGSEASTFAARRIRQTLQEELIAAFAKNQSRLESIQRELTKALFSQGLHLTRDAAQTLEGVSAALTKALLRLDAEFEAYALTEEAGSGTTACVAVIVDDKWLQVANIGDSRAILCSSPPPSGCASRCPLPTRRIARGKRNRGLCALDLTSDHRLDRTDEIERVQSVGGVVLAVGGVPRLMGVSMLSRAIGDVDLKQFGMIADPELSEWADVSRTDAQLLVLASDGVYEDIPGGQCVCDLIAGMGGASTGGHVEQAPAAIALGPSLAELGGTLCKEGTESELVSAEETEMEAKEGVSDEVTSDANAALQQGVCEAGKLMDVRETETQSCEPLPSSGSSPYVSRSARTEAKPRGKGKTSRVSERLPKLERWSEAGKRSRKNAPDNAGASVANPHGRSKVPHGRRRRWTPGGESDNENGPETESAGRRLLPVEIAERLRDAAFVRGSMDNIAAVIVDLQEIREARYRQVAKWAEFGESASASDARIDADISERDVSGVSRDVSDSDANQVAGHAISITTEAEALGSEGGRAVVQVGETAVAETQGFKVYISGQVVYGEGSEWCYQLVELVSRSPALPGPNPKTLAVSGETQPPGDEPIPAAETEPVSEDPFHTGFLDVQNALPESPSAWGTTLELYHRHLVATIDQGLGDSGLWGVTHGLRKFLDVVASVPVDPGGWTDARPARTESSKESTGEEFGEEWTPAGVQREEGDHRYRYVLRDNFAKGSFGEVWRAVRMPDKSAHNGRRCPSSPDGEPEEGEDCQGDAGTRFILKRLLVEKGGEVRLSGLREKFFGELLMNASATWQREQTTAHATPGADAEPYDVPVEGLEGGYGHLVRYVDSFEMHSGRELWLVFRDEGKSLREWMYDTPAPSGKQLGLGVVTPSAWWRWLRTDVRGQQEMKSIMWQLLVALRTCHQHDVTHRDVKPDNLLLVTRPAHGASDPSDWQQASNLSVRLIDFGSAWSPRAHHLYGTHGPSRWQETPEYSPPEALFAQEPWLPRRPNKAAKYDAWSAGVLFLELLLGTPHVFQVSSRTRALLDRHLAICHDATCKELAYTLRAFLELCIYPPATLPSLSLGDEKDAARTAAKDREMRNVTTAVDKRKFRWEGTHWFERLLSSVSKLIMSGVSRGLSTTRASNSRKAESGKGGALAWQCTEESFLNQLRARDPFGEEGEIDVWGARLLRRLLHWNPEERIGADEALEHAYFRKGLPGGYKCAACGREFESSAQCRVHSASLHEPGTIASNHCQ